MMKSEVMSNKKCLNETSLDLNHLLNQSHVHADVIPETSLNSVQDASMSQPIAVECSMEEQDMLTKLYETVSKTFTAMEKVRERKKQKTE